MSAPRRIASVAAVLVTCTTAALAYSGAVTVTALLAYLFPAVVVVGLVTARSSSVLTSRTGFAVGLGSALVLAELVNLASGTGNGPAARSTFVAAGCTAAAVALVGSRWPASFLLGASGVLVGALGLGAGAEVAPVAVATAVVAVVALGVVESQQRRWSGRRRGALVALAVPALLVGGAVALVALQADHQRDGEPTVLAPGAVDATIRPPQALGDPPRPTPTPTSSATRSPSPAPTSSEPAGPDVSVLWTWLGRLLVVLLLLVAGRVLWVWSRWRLLRRRLRRGTGPDRVAGAWQWSVRRLRAAGWPVPASMGPDRAAADPLAELPRAVRPALRRVAVATVDVVYAPPGGGADADEVWVAADEVAKGAVTTLPTARRLAFAVRPVSSTSSRPAASAPGSTEEQRL